MVRTITLLLAAAFIASSFADSGGPDAFGYTWKDNFEPDGPVFQWIDITTTGTQVLGLGDDNIVGPFVMETNMPFYWYNRKNIWFGSNGYIAFTNGNIASPFPLIPTVGGTNDYITGLMADLNFSGAGNPGQCWVYDETDLTIISYINVPFWTALAPSYTGSNTFQIILDKVNGTITVQFLTQTGFTQNNDITIGIESVAGSIGLQHSADTYPGVNYAIRYEPPVTPLITVTDATVNWSTEAGSGGLFRCRNGAPFSLRSNVKNIGNEIISGFTLTGSILNTGGQLLVNDQTTVGQLVPEQSTTINFGPTWSPVTAGSFRFRTTISGIPGELVTTNNQRIQEIVVVDTTTLTHDLRYHGATDDGLGLSWNGGNGGVGMHFIPPYHPAQATHTTVRILNNTGNVGFYMKVYRDDGPDGIAGTLLDSVYVPPAQATAGDKLIPLSAPIMISSGGVYVQWYMGGANISIAQDITPPFSLRSYEVLDGIWAEYRDRENVDFFIGLRLTQVPVTDVGCTGFFELADGQQVTGTTTVRAFIRNYGNVAVTNIPVRYRFANDPVVQGTYTGTPIQPGQQTLYTFTQPFTPATDAVGALCAWTDLGGDAAAANDTTCITIESFTSIAERAHLQGVVFPNPATDLLRISGLPDGTYQLRVFDATGRNVLQQMNPVNGTTLVLELHALSDGVHHLLLDGPAGIFSTSFVVIR